MWFISLSNSNSNILERFGIQKVLGKSIVFGARSPKIRLKFFVISWNQWFNSPLIRPYFLEGIALGGYLRFHSHDR